MQITRNDVLRRDLVDIVLKPGTTGCVVLTGTLRDPFGGAVVDFERARPAERLDQAGHGDCGCHGTEATLISQSCEVRKTCEGSGTVRRMAKVGR